MRIALVTYRDLPNLSDDDRRLLAPLAQRGIRADAVAWDDPAAMWDRYDGLVVRSTWNYHLSFDAFMSWIAKVDGRHGAIWNPPAVLRWNADKRYLRALAEGGVDVVPTRWISRGSAPDLAAVLDDAGWEDVVVKPAISASAHETWRVGRRAVSSNDKARLERLTMTSDVMVQPFLRELADDGEWSLMFFGGAFSHAVLKRPRSGDFRVQHEHGGSAQPGNPPHDALATALGILSHAPAPTLYARVDGVIIDRRFVLVELELLEPSMFLRDDPGAADRFADAICAAIGTK